MCVNFVFTLLLFRLAACSQTYSVYMFPQIFQHTNSSLCFDGK